MRKLKSLQFDRGETGVRALPPPGADPAGAPRTGLSPSLAHILREVERELGLLTEVSNEAGDGPGLLDLERLVQRVAERLGFELAAFEKDLILEQLEQSRRSFGILQPLVDDPHISDIIVSSFSCIAVQRGRSNYRTDVSFPDQDSYEAFVERLLKISGATCSTRKPIADGMIGAFARIHCVHRSLCDQGPYLTIRLNRFSRVGLPDLERQGLAPGALLDYLAGMITLGNTVLIVGEVGTGKTTLARALATAIPSSESILVIEDTPEIRLEHPHVRYVTTREANSDGAGRVAPSECIRAGMRMAMNRIVFGEMRDAEAAEAFVDVCASGHPGLSTIHAKTSLDALVRLELFLGRAQAGVGRSVLREQIATAVQVIVHVDLCRVSGRRRVFEVREIGPVADEVIRQREMFRYEPGTGTPAWRVMSKVSAYREQLERMPKPVVLSALPSNLEFEATQLYRQMAG